MKIRFINSVAPEAQAGFTLLELLIAMTLLALLAIMLMGSIHLGTRVWERAVVAGYRAEEVQTTADFLRESLGNAYPLLDRFDPTHPTLSFSGDASSVRYLAQMPEALGGGGFAKIYLTVEDRGGGQALFLHIKRELAFSGAALPPATILIDNIGGLRLGYFGATRRGEERSWHDTWESAVALPEIINVHVDFPSGDSRTFPDLMIVPRIEAEATCGYDPLTQDCRGR